MKILNIVGGFNKGGIETFIMNIIRSNAKNNDKLQIDVLCTCVQSGSYENEARRLGASVFFLPLKKTDKLFKFPLSLILMRKKYKKFFKNHKYDVVHIHTHHASAYNTAKYLLKLGIKNVIVHSHTSNCDTRRIYHRVLRKKLIKANITKIACSDLAAEWMFGKSKDVVNLFNGVETEKFSYNKDLRNDFRRAYDIGDRCVIGHIGRFETVKNHEFLLQVFKELSQIKKDKFVLFLIGYGSLKQKIIDLAVELGIGKDVIFEDEKVLVGDLINIFDIFVLPSISEGLSIVAVEAQVNGLPCLFSDTLSRQTMIKQDVDFVPLEINAWTAKLIEYSKRTRTNLNNIEQYDIANTCEKLKKIYTSFVN